MIVTDDAGPGEIAEDTNISVQPKINEVQSFDSSKVEPADRSENTETLETTNKEGLI